MTSDGTLALVRLLRLASPALPVGAFGYSQGLETAIQQGWVHDEASLQSWVLDVLAFTLARCDAVMLARLHRAWGAGDDEAVNRINVEYLAARETAEFRAESLQMGASLRTLFESTGEFEAASMQRLVALASPAFPAVFAFAAARWAIGERDTVGGYLFAWGENQVAAALKRMRLGHVAGQRILAQVAQALPAHVDAATCGETVMNNFTPALAIASSLHEMQDSRVFRS